MANDPTPTTDQQVANRPGQTAPVPLPAALQPSTEGVSRLGEHQDLPAAFNGWDKLFAKQGQEPAGWKNLVSESGHVPMLTPDGSQSGDVPLHRAKEARASGFHLAVPMVAPNRQAGWVPYHRVSDAIASGFQHVSDATANAAEELSNLTNISKGAFDAGIAAIRQGRSNLAEVVNDAVTKRIPNYDTMPPEVQNDLKELVSQGLGFYSAGLLPRGPSKTSNTIEQPLTSTVPPVGLGGGETPPEGQRIPKPTIAAKPATISETANEFNKSEGRPPINSGKVEEDPRSSDVADAYKAATHSPNDPAVKASYDALKADVDRQWDVATNKLGIKIDTSDTNPYGLNEKIPAHKELHNDVLNNKHLTVWTGGEPPADHPLSEVDPKTGLTYNTKFRAVHDIFGHAAEKNDFAPSGEESAWNLHRQMFSKEALPALATETKGQAAYTYKYGDFPPQKAAILPNEFQVRPEDLAEQNKPGNKEVPMAGAAAKPLAGTERYHPELQKVIAQTQSLVDDPSRIKSQAAFITPDGRFSYLRGGEQHWGVIGKGQLTPEGQDPRIDFINQTGAIRTRFATGRGGDTLHISVPKGGVTDEQITAMRQSVGQLGRNGNLVLETADNPSQVKSTTKEFVKQSDVEPMLREIGAHPDQIPPDVTRAQIRNPNYELSEKPQSYRPNEATQTLKEWGFTPEMRDHHEWGHVFMGAHEDRPAAEIRSEIHPEGPKGNGGFALFDWGKYPGVKLDSDGEPTTESIIANADKVMSMFSGGAAANELYDGIPWRQNKTLGGDVQTMTLVLQTADPRLTSKQAIARIDRAVQDSKAVMSREGMAHLIPEAAKVREGGLPATHIASEDRVRDFSEQVRRQRDAQKREGIGERRAAINVGEGQTNVAGTKTTSGTKVGTAPVEAVKPVNHWGNTADLLSERPDGGAVDPKTGKEDPKGFGVEIYPEARQRLDHAPTPDDLKSYYEDHKDIFDQHPDLRLGWYQDPEKGWELNIGANTQSREGAEWAARKLDQKGIYDIEKGAVIPTGGQNEKTSFGRYNLDQRMKDASGESFKEMQKEFPSQAETRSMIRAGQVAKTWWQDSRDTMNLLANSDPEAAHDLGQFLTAVSSNKGNDLALRLGLKIHNDWVDAGKPTAPGAISDIAEKAQEDLARSEEGQTLFGPVEPGKVQRMMPVDKLMLERYVGGSSFYHPEDLRSAKIANMGLTMGGDPWAGVLDRHTGRTMAYGKELQPTAKGYFAMKDWLRQAALSENMTLEEAQASNWVIGRLLSPDMSLTAPQILEKIKSGDTLKAGETYADIILNNPKVKELARRVISQSGGTPDEVFADIRKITESKHPSLIEGSKNEASNPTLKRYIGKAVRGRDEGKIKP